MNVNLTLLHEFLLSSSSSPVSVSSSASLLRSCPRLSSERTVTPCLLWSPRSPFSLYLFLAFQSSLVPLCLLIRGEQQSATTWMLTPVPFWMPSPTAHGLFMSEMGHGSNKNDSFCIYEGVTGTLTVYSFEVQSKWDLLSNSATNGAGMGEKQDEKYSFQNATYTKSWLMKGE